QLVAGGGRAVGGEGIHVVAGGHRLQLDARRVEPRPCRRPGGRRNRGRGSSAGVGRGERDAGRLGAGGRGGRAGGRARLLRRRDEGQRNVAGLQVLRGVERVGVAVDV